LLSGQYAFLMHGGDGAPLAMAGSFTADGAGHLTAGSMDQNRASSGPRTRLTSGSQAGTYTVGADQRGCLTLVTSGGTITFDLAISRISAGVARGGFIIEFDDATGSGTRAEGFLRFQDPAAFPSGPSGPYAFGLSGGNSSGQRVATAGVITADGAGGLSSNALDINQGGSLLSPSPQQATGSYSPVDSYGRGTMSLSVKGGHASNFIYYLASAGELLLLAADPVGPSSPIFSGRFLRQTVSNPGLSTLSGSSVVWQTGFPAGATGATVSIGVLVFDGNGGYSETLDLNQAGTFTPLVGEAGTYLVESSGRVTTTTTMGHPPPILYLVGPNDAWLLGTGAAAALGRLVPQNLGASFGNPSFSGTYVFGTDGPAASTRLIASGSVSIDGIGAYSGTEDDSTPGGLSPAVAFSGVYSFPSTSSPSGRGALDTHNPPHQLAYAVSPSLLVYFNTPAEFPRLIFVEK
jgi:hypothetical protein